MGVSITGLRPRLYRLVLGRYQAYPWHDDHSVTPIDTGEAGSGPAIEDASARLQRVAGAIASGAGAA